MTRDGWEKFAVLAALMGSAVFFASRAFAAEAVPWLDEMRIGAASTVPVGGGAAGTPFDASVELQALFSPLPSLAQPYDPNLSWLFSPRPLVGASISAEGKTDMAYLGLAWDVPISGPYFAEFFAGGLLHDQNLNKLYSDRPSPLTTRFLFHESIAIGRQIGPNWRIMAFADHSSNGDLVNGNVGINRVGVLLGDEFGASAKDAADSAPGKTPNSDLSAFSWAGPYVGFGVGLATDTIDFAAPAGLSGATEYKSVNLAAQGGYNWVIGRLVAGVEADAAVQNLNGNVLIGTAAVTARSHWLATARGRAGIDVDMPFIPYRFLLYGTGGAAFTDIAGSYCAVQCSGDGAYFDQQQFRTGWTAGGGVELPLAPTVMIKLEYLYVDFGRLTFVDASTPAEQFTFGEQIWRTGMNFKFN